jgi:hypothetical protein
MATGSRPGRYAATMHACVTHGNDRLAAGAGSGQQEMAALCERAAAVVAASPPSDDVLWLAEQLADACRRREADLRVAGVVAAAYERGCLDERARHAAAGHLLPA